MEKVHPTSPGIEVPSSSKKVKEKSPAHWTIKGEPFPKVNP
jgi:hypothetical protein